MIYLYKSKLIDELRNETHNTLTKNRKCKFTIHFYAYYFNLVRVALNFWIKLTSGKSIMKHVPFIPLIKTHHICDRPHFLSPLSTQDITFQASHIVSLSFYDFSILVRSSEYLLGKKCECSVVKMHITEMNELPSFISMAYRMILSFSSVVPTNIWIKCFDTQTINESLTNAYKLKSCDDQYLSLSSTNSDFDILKFVL